MKTFIVTMPPFGVNGITVILISLFHLHVSLLSALALLSFCVNVLAFLSVGWLALRGLVCCKQCLTITFT